MRRFIIGSALTFSLVCSLVALSSCSASMTSPSGSGATINGSLTSSAPAPSGPSDEVADVDSAEAGITVSIVGSNVQVTVDGNGHFTLTNVPGGDVILRFQGPGGPSTITVPAVQDGENITITVTITGTTASLDSDSRSSTDAGGLLQLEGRIDSLPPVAAAGTFVINGTVVETSAGTSFVQGSSTAAFTDLVLGMRVHVSGTADGTKIKATRVDIQNTNATLPVIVNGTVAGFTGSASNFQFTVDGTLVKGDSTTGFSGNSSFSDLANGKKVEVKGQPGNGFVFATSIHVN
jgi:hypothetical protein